MVKTVCLDFQRHSFGHFQAVAFKANTFAGIIGKQTHCSEAKISKNLGTDTIVPNIRSKSKRFVCFNSIFTFILQSISPDFIG